MFGISIGVNALVVLVAFFMFGGRELIARTRAGSAGRGRPSGDASPLGGGSGVRTEAGNTLTLNRTETHVETAPRPKLLPIQMLVITSIFVLVGGFFTLNQLDADVNLGVVALTIAVIIALVDPGVGRKAIARIDWSTTLLLGGIITYVAVLTRLGAIDQLGEAARSVSQPLLAAFVICVIAALVSAFASTIGIIGALIPLAVPLLVPGGGLEMTGFIYALAISASLVDCAPFGTTGATIVASTVEEHRPTVNRHLTIWGLSMVIIGPVVTLGVLVVPFLWA